MIDERRWGVMRVSIDFDTGFFCQYLPMGHRILATNHPSHCSYVEHIIEGPDMPPHVADRAPERVALSSYMDDSSITFAFWDHMPQKRWPVSAGSALVGD